MIKKIRFGGKKNKVFAIGATVNKKGKGSVVILSGTSVDTAKPITTLVFSNAKALSELSDLLLDMKERMIFAEVHSEKVNEVINSTEDERNEVLRRINEKIKGATAL